MVGVGNSILFFLGPNVKISQIVDIKNAGSNNLHLIYGAVLKRMKVFLSCNCGHVLKFWTLLIYSIDHRF